MGFTRGCSLVYRGIVVVFLNVVAAIWEAFLSPYLRFLISIVPGIAILFFVTSCFFIVSKVVTQAIIRIASLSPTIQGAFATLETLIE